MITLLSSHLDQMMADCRQRSPVEACGLVAGSSGVSKAVFPAINILNSPLRYRMDPAEQLRLFTQIEEAGWDLLAIYHSHPAGPSVPSPTDIAEAGYPDSAYIIWTEVNGEWSSRAFQIVGGSVLEIEVKILENSS